MSHMILSSFQLLELNVISAQDLAKISRKMKTYAVAWVHPDRKLSTRLDSEGSNNPTWNDKFVFRVDDSFLHGDTSSVMIEIYALHWFRDIHVGTVRVIVGNLIPPAPRPHHHSQFQLGMRFVALQVRRPSGRPQGILNIGVALLDSSMRSMPLYSQISASAVGYRQLMGEEALNHHKDDSDDESSGIHSNPLLLPWPPKPELRRTKSDSSSIFGSIVMAKRKMIMKGNGSSMISVSEVEERKMHNKGRSKASSMISGSELEKKNNEWRPKTSSLISGSKIVKKHENSNLFSSDSELNGAFGKASLSSESLTKTDTKSTDLDHILKPLPKFTGLDLGSPRNNKFRYAIPEKENFVSRPVITESELCPSPSEVAAVMARNKHRRAEETESEIIGEMNLGGSMEGLQSKLERWRAELPPVYDHASDFSSFPTRSTFKGGKVVKRHNHRHTDDNGTFSCFGRFCGLECSIVCGGPPRNKKTGLDNRSHSLGNLRYIN